MPRVKSPLRRSHPTGPEMLHPASMVFTPPGRPVDLRVHEHWWTFQRDANWRQPYGPGSSIEGLDDHPSVHVSYKVVEAYVDRAGAERRVRLKPNAGVRVRRGSEGLQVLDQVTSLRGGQTQ